MRVKRTLPDGGDGSTHWVYRLRDPVTFEVRYIGETYNPRNRYSAHLACAGSCLSRHWISGLKAQGHRPLFEIIYGPTDWRTAQRVERTVTCRTQGAYPGQLVGRKALPMVGSHRA
jgi:hypothetical protein